MPISWGGSPQRKKIVQRSPSLPKLWICRGAENAGGATTRAFSALAELRDLSKRRGILAGIASLWRFFQRRKITLKK
jgi:hypothetical protein